MIESESESDDDTSNNQSLPIFGTPSRTVSESPVHKAPSLGSLSTTPPDPVERPTRHGDSEFAIARIKIPAHGGSSKSLASLHSESSFNSSFEVVMSDLDDDDRMLYLLCARCIAFPFSAKYQLDTTPPKQKLNSAVLEKLRAALVECAELNGATKGAELTSWELKCTQSGDFTAAVRWYVANVLDNRNVRDLCGRGALSCRELSNIFEAYVKIHAERQSGKDSDMRHTLSAFTKLVESACDLPHNSYVLQTPVVSGGTLSSADQEKLYSTFQKILNISTGKHNLLYRICQLGNQDEQEAVVRKEIQKRREMLDTAAVNIGGSRQIQEMYKDAQFKILSHLTSLLDTRAFAKPPAQASVESQEPVLIKQDLKLSFKLHLTIHEVKVEAIQPDIKPVFCVFRLMNANESLTTHHEQINIQSKSARFDQIAEFTTNSPLPQIVFDFHMESKGFLRESKVIATKTYTVASMPSSDVTEWIELEEKGGAIVARLKISVFCEKPNNIKKCGYISCQGDLIFKEWRKRYFALLQLTGQYRFLLCCYKPMEAAPHKQVVLDGYSVEYLSKEEEEAHQDSDARWQFQLSSNKGTIRMGCKERSEREGWVQWMTRASGRDNKPDISGESQDLDKYTAIKDIVSADVTALDHNKLFAKMFARALEFQLKDPSFNRGLFSPGQLFVTSEYCSRYCVRDCTHHIICMQQWLKAEQEGMGVWPLMLYSSFRFVQMHVAGKKPNYRSVFVVEEERDALLDISHQIAELSASKVEGFKYCFPFGQPKDDLKVNIKLLSIVSYMQPGLSERGVADNKVLVGCMEKAAMVNYQDVYQRFVSEHSEEVSLEEYVPLPPPLMQALIQRCIDYMYELHDFYLDEFVECPSVLGDHIEAFWSFLLVDLQEALNVCDDVISKIQLFYVINQYFCSQPTLKLCKFHSNVLELFDPVVEEYIDSIGGSLMADLKSQGRFSRHDAINTIIQRSLAAVNVTSTLEPTGLCRLDVVPSPSIGLKAERIKTTSMTISWQPPHDVNGIIRGYQVGYTPHGESECLLDVVGDTTSTELTSLKPHTEYTIRVRAKTVDFGDYCTTISVSTLEEVPSPPIGLKAESIKTKSMTISWQPPHDVNGIIRGYQVSYTPHGENECLHDVVENTTSTELTSLKPHTEYTIRVRAKTVDFGDYSTPITISTLEEDLFILNKISSILDNYKDITFKQLRIIKLIFYGTPRTGKTTLRKQLLTSVEDPLQQSSATLQPSTNVAEICDPVFVERIVMTNEEKNMWRWSVQKLDDIAKMLLQCLDNQLLQCKKEVIYIREEPNVTAALGPRPVPVMPLNQYVHNEKMAGTPNVYVPPSQPIVTEREKNHVPKTMLPIVEQDEMYTSSTVIDIKQLFSEAVETGQWSEVVSALNIDKAMLMQVIDGGGQPSFQEIFPLLISGPSVTLVMFKLTDDLQKAHDVQYQPIDGVEHTWKDTYVVRDFIFHAISSTVPFTDCIQNPFGSKILLVGTHKDQIKGSEDQKKDKIMKIAKSMHGWLRELKSFKSIHVKNVEDLVTGIDNFQQQDIQKVKNKIEELVSQTPSKDIPAPWLVFDFVLHTYAKSKQLRMVEKIKCEQIAQSCGVKDEEIEVVLQYLHYEAGTLLYYSDIPELRDCVITDFQLIFDSISRIIIDYFDDSSEHGPHIQDKHLLHQKGHLKASVLKDVEGCLKVNELLALMQHRHIISKMDGDMFFMPSVLPKAELSYNKSGDSCSFLVMFEHGCCPIGLFCAVTTSLIVTHKWRVKKDEPQFRDKISLYCSGKKSYHIIFSAFFAHYEICLMDREAKPNIRYAIYKVINEVFKTVCKDMNYPPPLYGFYCPKLCTYGGVTYVQNEHPAKCTFDMEAQEMTCYYSDVPSDLTEEHKSWFQEMQPQEQINGTPTIKLLTGFPYLVDGVKTNLSIIQRTSTSYTKLGMYLLNDDNCDIVHALREKYHHDPVEIVTDIYKKWISGTGRTWQTLISVLREIELNSVADDIEHALNHPA